MAVCYFVSSEKLMLLRLMERVDFGLMVRLISRINFCDIPQLVPVPILQPSIMVSRLNPPAIESIRYYM
jgi:hypothetical protein